MNYPTAELRGILKVVKIILKNQWFLKLFLARNTLD